MQKYPLPLKSGQEAMMLEVSHPTVVCWSTRRDAELLWVRVQGVGPNIALKLDQLLPRLQKEIEKNKRTTTTTKTTSRTAGHSTARTLKCVCACAWSCVHFLKLHTAGCHICRAYTRG